MPCRNETTHGRVTCNLRNKQRRAASPDAAPVRPRLAPISRSAGHYVPTGGRQPGRRPDGELFSGGARGARRSGAATLLPSNPLSCGVAARLRGSVGLPDTRPHTQCLTMSRRWQYLPLSCGAVAGAPGRHVSATTAHCESQSERPGLGVAQPFATRSSIGSTSTSSSTEILLRTHDPRIREWDAEHVSSSGHVERA